jgi:hypothetical protein
MRKRQISKGCRTKSSDFSAEMIANSDDRPGLSTDERIAAVARDNAKVREWLDEQGPVTEWKSTWGPPARDGWALRIIALFEGYYSSTGNPAFVWGARQIARDLLPNLPKNAPGLQWIEAYIDAATERMAGLVSNPPKEEVNNHIAEALGFDPHPGRGQGSALSKAQRVIRDVRLAGDVLARLPHEGEKEEHAVAYVAAQNGLKPTTVWNAFRRYRSEIN